ncbi:hypothetical protein [Kitasatospora sp. NPDC056184]|uniref:hypothetical protein n=1 Tax=Kitasatospora sp. NPDC056184 TaxID=3345738 RepID=UPI0035D721BB
MNATPEDLSQRAEREELARLLPAAAARGLSPHRHLLRKEHLMDALTEDSRPAPAVRRHRGLALRLALPVGLSVAVAGLALTSLPGDPAGRNGSALSPATSASTSASTSAATSPGSPDRITNAAYELVHTDDRVTLTVLDGTKPVDTEQLQRDLDRLGVPTRVYGGQPGCGTFRSMVAPVPKDATGKGSASSAFIDASAHGGRTVFSIRPGSINAGEELILYLPVARPGTPGGLDGLEAGVLFGATPSCAPTTSPAPTPSAG